MGSQVLEIYEVSFIVSADTRDILHYYIFNGSCSFPVIKFTLPLPSSDAHLKWIKILFFYFIFFCKFNLY